MIGISFGLGRRNSASLSLIVRPSGRLSSFWTVPFGFVAGLFIVGRIARWLQVLLRLWKGGAAGTGSYTDYISSASGAVACFVGEYMGHP
jgi:hypothetical protein